MVTSKFTKKSSLVLLIFEIPILVKNFIFFIFLVFLFEREKKKILDFDQNEFLDQNITF